MHFTKKKPKLIRNSFEVKKYEAYGKIISWFMFVCFYNKTGTNVRSGIELF